LGKPGETTVASRTGSDRLHRTLVPVVFLLLAVLLWSEPWRFVSPVPAAVQVPAWATDTTPVRHARLRPEIELAGYTYACSDCHNLFPSPPETTRSLTQHRDIVLDHGINDRCFNCHHLTNRDTFVDDWGREIPYDRPPLLCAKCHGPVYRDWLHGSHGRTNGYWDTKAGPQRRLKCIECHDPHRPAFPSLRPAPPPNTLRMGEQRPPSEHPGAENPLRYRGSRSGFRDSDIGSSASDEPEREAQPRNPDPGTRTPKTVQGGL